MHTRAPSGRERAPEPLPAALVGLGRWGEVLRGKLCAPGAPFALRATHDARPERPQSHTLAALLADDGARAAFVATPPHTHHAVAAALLEAGKHVWLEKPCGASLRELRDLRARAAARGRALHLGYTYLHHPLARLLAEEARALPAPSAATPWEFTATRLQSGPLGAPARRPCEALYDLGVHDLTLLKMCLPALRAEGVEALLVAPREGREGRGEGLTLTLRAPHLRATLTAAPLAAARARRFTLTCGGEGGARLSFGLDAEGREALWVGEGAPRYTPAGALDALEEGMRSFAAQVRALEGGAPPSPPAPPSQGGAVGGGEVGELFHALMERAQAPKAAWSRGAL